MNILAKHSQGKVLANDGLALSSEAKKAKLLNPNVINSTIGTLYNEDGSFGCFQSVNEIIKNLNDDDFYSYSASSGTVEFHNAVIDWVFGKEKENILNNMYCKSLPTPGGTGAVSNSLYNSLDEGEILLLPDIYWKPYVDMALSNSLKVMEYPLIKNNRFNINDFKKYSETIMCKQNKVVTILNDPCNNPTGYSLSNDEFLNLINFMNEHEETLFNVILDIAYFDYSIIDREECRKKFSLLTKANHNIVFNICFSCSKSFSLYGLRLGSQIIVSKSETMVNDIYDSSCFLARTRWSNVSKAGMSFMSLLFKNRDLRENVIYDLDQASKLVNERAQLFIEMAHKKGLYLYPYRGGFFITIIHANPILLTDELKKKDVYVLPVSKGIRIAICSLNKTDIIKIIEIISETIINIK